MYRGTCAFFCPIVMSNHEQEGEKGQEVVVTETRHTHTHAASPKIDAL